MARVHRKHRWTVHPDDDLPVGCPGLQEVEESYDLHFPRLAMVVGACDCQRSFEQSPSWMDDGWHYLSAATVDEAKEPLVNCINQGVKIKLVPSVPSH